MSVFKKIMTGAAAMSLAVVPVAAHAADASKLSVARASTSAKAKNDLGGGGGFFVAVIAAIAVIVGIIIVANEDDDPDSN